MQEYQKRGILVNRNIFFSYQLLEIRSIKSFKSHTSLSRSLSVTTKPHVTKLYNTTAQHSMMPVIPIHEEKSNHKLKGVLDKFVGQFFSYCFIYNGSHLLDLMTPTTTMDNIEISGPMDISTPYNTKHVTHVGFDADTGQFTGLPREWHVLLKSSGITQMEQETNPQVNTNIGRTYC